MSFLPTSFPGMHKEEEWTTRRIAANNPHQGGESEHKATGSVGELSSPEQTEDKPNGHSTGRTDGPQRRRLVFTDPVAFRYLEEDHTTVVLERRGQLKGYELYLVEQWACSRVHPTFIITTYTGNQNHNVVVGVLSVPVNEDSWSPRLRVYVNAVSQFHARPKDTPLGSLMVTNLSGFPSALTVIPIPDGDTRAHRENFFVNENLKRLGCSGRAGLSLSEPAAATGAKFHQLYKTSDHVKLYSAVIELVKLCQVALMIFGKLEQEYADGLLCDVTEKAVNDWWTEVGLEYFNLEPNDGILGPTTVAALLGLLMGARNRLNYYGAPVAKDVFDIASLKRGIAYFQKSQKLPRNRRLDRPTLAQLHRVTAKAAAGEGWAVPKAVKSTVTELSGKGGEMMMGMIGGGREKAGIGDIETLDIDRFISLVHGERSKWLWYGKARRHGAGDTFGKALPPLGNMVFISDGLGQYGWTTRKNELDYHEESDRKLDTGHGIYSDGAPGSAIHVPESPNQDKDRELRKNVFKSVTGKMNDARSGLGRIKDAVGFRGHISRPSKDDVGEDGQLSAYFTPNTASTELDTAVATSGNQSVGLNKTFTWKNKPEEDQNGYRKESPSISAVSRIRDSESPPSEPRSIRVAPEASEAPILDTPSKEPTSEAKWTSIEKNASHGGAATDPSVAESTAIERLDVSSFLADGQSQNAGGLFFRRHSIATDLKLADRMRNEEYWPRHMSFSDAEDVVFRWEDIGGLVDGSDESDTWPALMKQRLIADDLHHLHSNITQLQRDIVSWVDGKVDGVDGLNAQVGRDQEDFQTIYYELVDTHESMKQSSEEIMMDERLRLTEAVKDLELLCARLEYEVNVMASKVDDVEDGVKQFETMVEDVELRAAELEKMLKTETWLHWIVRTLTGIGTGPHML